MTRWSRALGVAVGAGLLAGCSVGCSQDPTQPNYEFMPDMADSVAYETFAPNPVTPDGKTLMAPAKGTIARGQKLFHYGPGPEEAARAGRELHSPVPPSKETVARGEKLYGTFCASCHGTTGQGDGPVIPKFPAPPPLTAAHAKGLADGQLFHVITHGQGLMPAHGAQVRYEDRWQLVHYLRAMQEKGAKP